MCTKCDNMGDPMKDIEQDTKAVIEQFSLLIRKVIQRNLHRGDGIDLEDVEQEVRVKIWTFLKKGKKIDNLPSYIKRVAYSQTIDELRKAMKQRPSSEPESLRRVFSGADQITAAPMDLSPESRLDERETRESLGSMVDSLSENRRKVLRLFLKGLTIEEISSSLQWDKTTVRHLFYRGIDDLRELRRSQAENAGPPLSENPAPGTRS
jgi:RNA polymerase sigma factor (sigma-70 family)